MRPVASPQPTGAPADAAVVVFMRPSGVMGRAMTFTVIDGNGRFLGDAQADARFAVTLPPGEHLFLTWSETTGPMRANLAAGRVYYVQVSIRPGAFKARVDLLAVAPRTDRWKELAEFLKGTDLFESDQAKGQASLATKQDRVRKRIQSAKETLTELDQDELMERTLLPEDGVPSPGAPPLNPQPPAPAQSLPAEPQNAQPSAPPTANQ